MRAFISVLYAVALLAVPSADAILEAHALENDTHVEAPTHEPCSTGHAEHLCQLCRTLETPQQVSPHDATEWDRERAVSPYCNPNTTGSLHSSLSARSRAPPIN